jgi:hypothetical protein
MSETGQRAPRYFVNGYVDAFVVSGVTLAVFALFRLWPTTATAPALRTIGVLLIWGVNYPHFASTSYRLYGSRESLRQYPMTALVTPLLFAAVIMGSFLSPGAIAPALVKIYQLWSPYHFSGQTLGLTVLYARRCAFALDGRLRQALTVFVFSTFIYSSVRGDTGIFDTNFYGVTYPSLGLPTWVLGLARLGMAAAGLVLVAEVLRRRIVLRQAIPLMVLLPALTQFIWFAPVSSRAFANLVPFFHSLQYLLIAWSLQLRQTLDRSGKAPSRRFVTVASVRWIALNIVGGYVLFWFFPIVGARFGRSLAFSTAVVLAGIQLHHFFVDGVIWRLRNPGVRGPLSSSLSELTGRAEALAVGS